PQRLFWFTVSLLSNLALFGISYTAFSVASGDWIGFFQSPARVGALAVTLALSSLALFSDFGGMNPGKKEDRGNRWIFGPLIALALAMAVIPPFLDGRNLWTTDSFFTPYFGLALLTLGGSLRLAAVFVLGRRFTGLAAIQEGHRLQTTGLYRLIRHPNYTRAPFFPGALVLVFHAALLLPPAPITLPLLLSPRQC